MPSTLGRRVVVEFAGLISAGPDFRFLLRLNGFDADYKSFVIMDGNSGGGEWDETGFYLGRTGWNGEAYVAGNYIISVGTGFRRTGFGMSTFAHSDGRVLGYTAHGLWGDLGTPVTSVTFHNPGERFTMHRFGVTFDNP